MKDPAFLFYYKDFLVSTTFMTLEEIGAYVKLLCFQADRGHLAEENIKRKVPLPVWENIKEKFIKDENGHYYNARLDMEIEKRRIHSEHQKKNAHMRWHKNGICDGIALAMPLVNANANVNVNEDKDVNKVKSCKKGGVGGKKSSFTPPSHQEVETYCQERKNNVDPQKWHSWYTANGWKVGKNPMKDWQAAVRTWERKEAIGTVEGNLTKAQRSNLAGLKRTMERISKNDQRGISEGLPDIGGGLPRLTIQ